MIKCSECVFARGHERCDAMPTTPLVYNRGTGDNIEWHSAGQTGVGCKLGEPRDPKPMAAVTATPLTAIERAGVIQSLRARVTELESVIAEANAEVDASVARYNADKSVYNEGASDEADKIWRILERSGLSGKGG